MGQSSFFQIALIIGLVAIIGLAVLVFAMGGVVGKQNENSFTSKFAAVRIWGTFPQSAFSQALNQLSQTRKDLPVISYMQLDPRYYGAQITEALATEGGPDLFFIDETTLLQHYRKVTTITFERLPIRTFKDRYIEGAEIFLLPDVIFAVPFAVDPLVLYWNRDLLTAAGFTAPPQYWDQIYDYVKKMTKKSPDGLDIERSTIALGDYSNINHATKILSTLFMQSGVKVTRLEGSGRFVPDIYGKGTEAALSFYTEFSNPTSAAYSWNRALPSSRDAFIGHKLALYIGPATEYRFIREANPNLNFDVALIPQPRDIVRPVTYGNIAGLAISRMSKNKLGAYQVAYALSDPDANAILTDALGLVPIRRDLLGIPQADPWKSTAYRSGLNAMTWYQPAAYYTDQVFKNMVESVVGGRKDVGRSLGDSSNDLSSLLGN